MRHTYNRRTKQSYRRSESSKRAKPAVNSVNIATFYWLTNEKSRLHNYALNNSHYAVTDSPNVTPVELTDV
jgi:hypothetical protein